MTLFENASYNHPLRVDRSSALLFGFKVIPQIEVSTVWMSEVEIAFYPSALLLTHPPVLMAQDIPWALGRYKGELDTQGVEHSLGKVDTPVRHLTEP